MSKLPDHVGIDFGNYSVKAVELKGIHTNSPTLVAFGKQTTPPGVINSDDKGHQKKLAEALKSLYKNNGLRNKQIVIAIPESAVFTRFIELPGLKEDEIETAVYYKAKQYIPIPIEEVNMSYILLGFNESRNAYNALVVAAPKNLVNLYTDVVVAAGLDPLAVETESVAIGRSMFKSTGVTHAVMLNFGSQTTDMGIMYEGQMIFSQSIAIGSDSMTQALVNQFGLEYNQAEQYKRNYGITYGVLENKIYNALKPMLDAILTEVQRGVEFYKTSTVRSAPRDYLLNGDAALLPGLQEYLKKNFEVNSHIADPWKNINVPNKLKESVSKDKPAYAVAVGLALKEY
jgi:type IV pilus assembly protein PilM